MTQEQEYFWNQYHGLVRAIDLPLWYQKKDTRIDCCNEHCFLRDKCVFFARYKVACKVFGRNICRGAIRDAKGHQRNAWDKNYPNPDYRLASFTMNPEQKGNECRFFFSE